jgi:hypothetical protein
MVTILPYADVCNLDLALHKDVTGAITRDIREANRVRYQGFNLLEAKPSNLSSQQSSLTMQAFN